MQLHECSDVLRHVVPSRIMELVAQNAHVDDLNAATSSAYLVFTATL